MVTGPELMRQVHLDTYGEEDQHVEAALELRRRWLRVHSELDSGGTLYVEKEGVVSDQINVVMIAWRPLDWDNDFDWKLIKLHLSDDRSYPPERYDWLVAWLAGDRILFQPHALCLLNPYTLPVESL